MKLLDLVKQRYSCRSYLEKSVEQEKLDYVMECVERGRQSEAAGVLQPRVVRDGSDVHHL